MNYAKLTQSMPINLNKSLKLYKQTEFYNEGKQYTCN